MTELGNKEIMSRNIKYYMTRYNKSRSDMCKALGVKYTTFCDWVNAKTYPRIDKIELILAFQNPILLKIMKTKSSQPTTSTKTQEKLLTFFTKILNTKFCLTLHAILVKRISNLLQKC